MQFTTKFAFLAAAVAGALAAPLVARDIEYELDARDVEDLSAREFYDMYLEVRADPTLDARTVEAMDLEAREYLAYLEAREAATVSLSPWSLTTLQLSSLRLQAVAKKPLEAAAPAPATPTIKAKPTATTPTDETAHHRSRVADSASTMAHPGSHILFKPSKAQKTELKDPKALEVALNDPKSKLHNAASYIHRKKLAVQDLKQNPEHMQKALSDKTSRFHRLAVNTYFADKTKLAAALKDKKDPHHKDAERFEHRQKAKTYFKTKGNFKKALSQKKNKFHKQAVRQYLNNTEHFKKAFTNKKSKLHKAAVRIYLRHNPSVYKAASDCNHIAAVAHVCLHP